MNALHQKTLSEPIASVAHDRHERWSWVGKRRRWYLATVLMAAALACFWLQADFWFGNGLPDTVRALAQSSGFEFDYSNPRIPVDQIRAGGPPKDGIPALTRPAVVPAAQANYLQASDRVIGFSHGEHARAYPLGILNYHEIVNDDVAGVPIAVTYCPLCDSAAVFDRRVGENKVLEFGVSGLLYNSNVLMYERGTLRASLWSQLAGTAVTGRYSGQRLVALPVELTTWADWSQRHPQTDVLSPQTGHSRNYGSNPYSGYFRSPGLMFPVSATDERLPPKTPVLGVWTEGSARAYPVSAFRGQRQRIDDVFDGKQLTLEFDPGTETIRVVDADEGIGWMYSLWFAWYAFRPDTSVHQAGGP